MIPSSSRGLLFFCKKKLNFLNNDTMSNLSICYFMRFNKFNKHRMVKITIDFSILLCLMRISSRIRYKRFGSNNSKMVRSNLLIVFVTRSYSYGGLSTLVFILSCCKSLFINSSINSIPFS